MEVVAAWGKVSRPFVFIHRDCAYLFLPDASTWDKAQMAVEALLCQPGMQIFDPDMIRRLARDAWNDPEKVSAVAVTVCR